MASARDIVNGALRKIGKLAGGREPRTQDSLDALEVLKGLYSQLINSGAFGRLRDVTPTGARYIAGENERIFRNSDVTQSIELPQLVARDGCGPLPYDQERVSYPSGDIDNVLRPPRDCAVVAISDAFTGITAEYVYDGQRRTWAAILDLGLPDHAPLSDRDAEGLKCMLAEQLVDEFGGTLGEMTVRGANNFRAALVHRFSSPASVGASVYF